MNDKFTLADFLNRYSDDGKCLDEIKNMKYPNGIHCKSCEKVTKHYRIKKRTAFACAYCGTQVYPLKGTVFEKTTTPLRLWFYAMFVMINTRAGISAKQLQREIGVTYKTAWRMLKQIRTLMSEEMMFNDGIVEIDETYVGGKPRLHEYGWQNPKPKEIIMGMVQRDGKVYLRHVTDTGKWTILSQVKNHISPKVRVITDQYYSYKQLKYHGYKHDSVNHKVTYVKGDIHTQNIENVWSHLKRGIFGVYRHVSKKYLQAYADEFAFRYNNRKSTQNMFTLLLSEIMQVRMISAKRLFLAV